MRNAFRWHGTIARDAFALHRLQILHPKPQNANSLSESIVFKSRGAPRNRQKRVFRFSRLRIWRLHQKSSFFMIVWCRHCVYRVFGSLSETTCHRIRTEICSKVSEPRWNEQDFENWRNLHRFKNFERRFGILHCLVGFPTQHLWPQMTWTQSTKCVST